MHNNFYSLILFIRLLPQVKPNKFLKVLTNQRLLASLQLSRVPAKLLLAEVRRVYMARSHKWQNSKRKVEALPMALAGELVYDAITDSVSSKSDDVSAERAVRRYLAIANKLVRAAACGDFPSRDYFKV